MLTDPDARSMATSGRRASIVGYNVQTVVDAMHHLIVAHQLNNVALDRDQLAHMAKLAKEATAKDILIALADCGYYKGYDILACERAGFAAQILVVGLPSVSDEAPMHPQPGAMHLTAATREHTGCRSSAYGWRA